MLFYTIKKFKMRDILMLKRVYIWKDENIRKNNPICAQHNR